MVAYSLLRRASLIGGIILSCLFGGSPAQAQVTTDGTLPTPTQVTEQENVSEIEGGTTRGDNLFHSFQEFSVSNNNSHEQVGANGGSPLRHDLSRQVIAII